MNLNSNYIKQLDTIRLDLDIQSWQRSEQTPFNWREEVHCSVHRSYGLQRQHYGRSAAVSWGIHEHWLLQIFDRSRSSGQHSSMDSAGSSVSEISWRVPKELRTQVGLKTWMADDHLPWSSCYSRVHGRKGSSDQPVSQFLPNSSLNRLICIRLSFCGFDWS